MTRDRGKWAQKIPSVPYVFLLAAAFHAFYLKDRNELLGIRMPFIRKQMIAIELIHEAAVFHNQDSLAHLSYSS